MELGSPKIPATRQQESRVLPEMLHRREYSRNWPEPSVIKPVHKVNRLFTTQYQSWYRVGKRLLPVFSSLLVTKALRSVRENVSNGQLCGLPVIRMFAELAAIMQFN
jgi:hypothetical protein